MGEAGAAQVAQQRRHQLVVGYRFGAEVAQCAGGGLGIVEPVLEDARPPLDQIGSFGTPGLGCPLLQDLLKGPRTDCGPR